MDGFYHILAQMLETCRMSTWNLENVLSSGVWFIYDILSKSPFRNYSLFPHKKWSVGNLQALTGLKTPHDYFESNHVVSMEPVQFIISLLLHNELVLIVWSI